MARRRSKLRIAPGRRPGPGRKLAVLASGVIPGILAGAATMAAVRYLKASRNRNNSRQAGVLTAEVHSNGHSKVQLGSLESFS